MSDKTEQQFENPQIQLADTPKHEDLVLQPIAKRYWNIIVIRLLIRFLAIGVVIFSLILSIDPLNAYLWPVLIIYLLVVGLSFYWQRTAFPKRGFAIRKHDIIYRRGVLSTIKTIVPFQRVQHVAVNESFLSRKYGLAQLQVFTAGGSSSDIKISGLEKEDAERMKSQIMLHMVEPQQNA